MFRTAAALLVASSLALAADKAPAKPAGTWEREAGEAKITFEIKADGTMTLKVKHGDNTIDARASYGVTDEGVLFATMTKVEAKDGKGPEKGDLFSFSFTVSKGEMTISDLKGTKVNDQARKLVEGVYTKK